MAQARVHGKPLGVSTRCVGVGLGLATTCGAGENVILGRVSDFGTLHSKTVLFEGKLAILNKSDNYQNYKGLMVFLCYVVERSARSHPVNMNGGVTLNITMMEASMALVQLFGEPEQAK